MKKAIKKTTFKCAEFLGTLQRKLKRIRTKARTRIKRLLRQSLSFQNKEILEDIHRKFTF